MQTLNEQFLRISDALNYHLNIPHSNSTMDLFDDTATILNFYCFKKLLWDAQGANAYQFAHGYGQTGCFCLADVVLGSPVFNFSATLVNSQLVCLPPVGILNLVMFV